MKSIIPALVIVDLSRLLASNCSVSRMIPIFLLNRDLLVAIVVDIAPREQPIVLLLIPDSSLRKHY